MQRPPSSDTVQQGRDPGLSRFDSASRPPTISIVTPSFNQARFLEATIRSVSEQGYPAVEHLVLDGGSTDQSVEIIKRHSRHLAYWRSERDGGQADAIRKGFDLATGEIFGWLNSDDALLPGALWCVGRFFATHANVDVLSGGAYRVDANGRPVSPAWGAYTLGVAATYDRLRFCGMDGVYQPATFWRASAYRAVGGVDAELRFTMDRDLLLRLAKRGPFGRTHQFLAVFREHEESKSSTWLEAWEHDNRLMRERYGVLALSDTTRVVRYWRHRIPSLCRKAVLRGMRAAGVIHLEALDDMWGWR